MKKKAAKRGLESDLYAPVKAFLCHNGYVVRSEVKDCDITAQKDDELILIELKTSVNLTLLIQGTQRQKITDSVYVAVPMPSGGIHTKAWRKIEHVLKRLELGLLVVNLRSKRKPVEIVFHPLPFERKKQARQKRALLKEIEGRSGDYNQGGSTQTARVTAYREQAIFIACCLETFGEMTPRELRALGTCDKTQSIVYDNHYGWFERVDRGIYAVHANWLGERENYKDVVCFYDQQVKLLQQERDKSK
jgi:hypothetical protein